LESNEKMMKTKKGLLAMARWYFLLSQ